jgi:hypothetical protein
MVHAPLTASALSGLSVVTDMKDVNFYEKSIPIAFVVLIYCYA